ncbi:Lead, cadmium, zinc and mercury transporting ATPase; Copper-translocating P-type ATPase [hydrothermal vent metagenome]|uniref:Lead, cadmium, zinc and mercury transporting ATPase Copper-translocating P-type ATPase n=1 Tax=hydrothermal vent metagenome TaxID=652676 RepID=A0A3B0WJ03_9ZZZZ
MKNIQIEIPVLIPNMLGEKDQCIQRIINLLENKKGVDSVHVDDVDAPRLCIHYEPAIVSLAQVKSIAEQCGVEVSTQFQHRLLEVTGIRHQRHARSIEQSLQKNKGIIESFASVAGVIRLEWDNRLTNEQEVLQAVKKLGLSFFDVTADDAEHKHAIENKNDHDHKHGGIFGESTELYFAIGSGAFWLLGLVLSFVEGVSEQLPLSFFIIAFALGGYFTLIEAYETIRNGRFEIDFLMLVAAAGAAALGKWEEGALLLFLFSLGHALEAYAMNKARRSIAALSNLTPLIAVVKRDGQHVEVGIEELVIGDVIIIKPNTKIAADGVIIAGNSAVNQAAITGESMPVDKIPVEDSEANFDLNTLASENRAFAGTINGSMVLEVKVLKAAKDSTLSRLVELVKEAETQKSPTQLLTDRFEKYFVPAVLFLVTVLLFAFTVIDESFKESFYRAMAVLVAASPCALAISTPSAVLAGVARAARQGVLIKGGRPLEDLGSLTAVAFDKTGTLTEGRPKLTNAIAIGNVSQEELLTVAVAVEELSDHPLAGAIVKGGKKLLGNNNIPAAQELEALVARGIKAIFKGKVIHIGNRRLFNELTGKEIPEEITAQMSRLEEGGHTAMIVHQDNQYLGIISVMDVARKESKATLVALKKIGIRRMIMLTGDNQKVADAVARTIGITDPMGSLLPEDKVVAIEKLKAEEGKVAMVGDGVNDAPAMAKSTVGIAMGAAGSDVALETADIALMADKLDNLPFAIGLSRMSKGIIKQNLWVSLGIVAVLIPSTIMGWMGIGLAVLIHEGSTLLVVGNALRLLAYKSE